MFFVEILMTIYESIGNMKYKLFFLLLWINIGILNAQILMDLRCEYLVNPIGVDNIFPRFSWKIKSDSYNVKQVSYSIIVSEDSLDVKRGIGKTWSSGEILSTKNISIYSGEKLKPKTRYYWSVCACDNNGNKYLPTSIPYFETGKLDEKWTAEWISDDQDTLFSPSPYFRKSFLINREVQKARIYVAVAGLIELSVNGQQVSDDCLNPMFTRFDKRCLYLTYDVTELIANGKNALGVILGNGWYNFQSHAVWGFENAKWRNRPTFCLELDLYYADGTKEVILSDSSWKTSSGPIVFNSIYTGEHYNACYDLLNWNLGDYDSSSWDNVVIRNMPTEKVVSQLLTPIRVTQEYGSLDFKKINDSIYLYKFPVNIAGVTKISVSGEKGTTIYVKHGEAINENGRVDQSTINIYSDSKNGLDPFQTDKYILKGNGIEEFVPKFNYKGFQYVEVIGDRPIKMSQSSVIALQMNSDVTPIGKIYSSNDILNKIWEATNRSYLANLFGYPTDCPQREKNGWTGDAHIALETALYNYDVVNIYEKWMGDHRDAQLENGILPAIIPTSGWGYTWGNGPDWTSTMLIVPWMVYLFYNDTQILWENYDSMKLYVDYITSVSNEGLVDWGLGDWVPYQSIANKTLLISIYYYYDTYLLSKIAKILNKSRDALYYERLSCEVKKKINDTFFDRVNAIYANGCQSELSLPLYFGIVPTEYRQKVADNLARRVIADNKHLDVGLLGSKALLSALSDNGYADLAFEVATQTTYPSWGYWIMNGATTLYETWNIKTKTLSRNHIMFGDISAWFYKALGGINIDETNPAFHSIIIKPHFVKGLNFFNAEYNSFNGLITSIWKRTAANQIEYTLVIPPNSQAIVNLGRMHFEVYKDNSILNVILDRDKNFKLGSGTYNILIKEKDDIF